MDFDESGRTILDDYINHPPFASFLPGIAGLHGIPLWVFTVNRGQAVASFGIESKQSPILEFQPANMAYRAVATTGFRTFIKVDAGGGQSTYHEPFSRFSVAACPQTQMRIGFNDLEISDTGPGIGLETRVLYFVLPSESFAALVRKVVVQNTSGDTRSGELLDGLPAIIPYGIPNGLLKEIGNTIMAWMRAENLDRGVPFYRIGASIEDRPEVEEFEAGHFYLSFVETSERRSRLTPIVDANVVFGLNTSLSYPDGFLAAPLESLTAADQITTGKVPCGFFGTPFTLAPGQAITLYSLIGHVGCVEMINDRADALTDGSYLEAKHQEAVALGETLTEPVETQTASRSFDLYCRQSFLDNVLRGGYPLVFPTSGEPHVYHVYSRRHGDLERDYNFFTLAPEYYSQGNGAYRDVNQNRRNDVFVEPRVGDRIVTQFMNLIQTDGYNPLEILAASFTLSQEHLETALALVNKPESVRQVLSRPFTPGGILRHLEAHDITPNTGREAFLEFLLRHAGQNDNAAHREGYWVDHWSYNLDLIDTYLAVYPDAKEPFLFDRRQYTFYDNSARVLPRRDRYAETEGVVRQFGSVALDPAKQELIAARHDLPHTMRAEQGRGPVYRTHLFGKLVCLCTVKFATLDPYGMGVEMEAGKPGWYDPLNGLPGLFGSSLSETYEIRRLVDFLTEVIDAFPARRFALAEEVWDFLQRLAEAVNADREHPDDWTYWDRVSRLREAYRERTRFGFTGHEVERQSPDLRPILDRFRAKLEAGIARAKQFTNGLPPNYFTYEAVEWTVLKNPDGTTKRNAKGQPNVRVHKFKPAVLPLFLEGVVKEMKLAASTTEATALHKMVRRSPLYDTKLGMYMVNASLEDQSVHIGRARAYTRGWLENESIFLHMHYKYLLALLSAGLHETFWEEAKKGLVPFFDPARYGRSVLENSSFIVSSVHPDASLHGRGFVARLSGAAAEFLSMWTQTLVGPRPFASSGSGLTLRFTPALPGWLFRDDGTLRFTFLGRVAVTYHNPQRKDLFPDRFRGTPKIRIRSSTGEQVEFHHGQIPEPWASRVRKRKVDTIDVFFDHEPEVPAGDESAKPPGPPEQP
jgi:hypothetical protein